MLFVCLFGTNINFRLVKLVMLCCRYVIVFVLSLLMLCNVFYVLEILVLLMCYVINWCDSVCRHIRLCKKKYNYFALGA